jgi:hypothetical protein
MAKQIGLIKAREAVGYYTYYRTENGYRIREKSAL